MASFTRLIDLRSDTITKPCLAMRQRMAEAEVGDDVYREDPTVNKLEQKCVEIFGKEAALFVPTGTMANLLSVLSHTRGYGRIIIGEHSHIQKWEGGGYARFGHVSAAVVKQENDGTISTENIRRIACRGDFETPQTTLICLENTHNFSGGKPLSKEYMTQVRKVADEFGMKIHVDGARIYNAAIKLNVSIKELVSAADSVSMCFSKGLGAPVGSIIVGSKEFIDKARYDRKALGGGWRQAGVLAAAALYGLENALHTIAEDHRRAELLATKINELNTPNFHVNLDGLTNMVMVECLDGSQLEKELEKHGILSFMYDEKRVRLVTHRCISDDDINHVIEVFRQLSL